MGAAGPRGVPQGAEVGGLEVAGSGTTLGARPALPTALAAARAVERHRHGPIVRHLVGEMADMYICISPGAVWELREVPRCTPVSLQERHDGVGLDLLADFRVRVPGEEHCRLLAMPIMSSREEAQPQNIYQAMP